MAESTINNRRIAKNTIFLYIRMIVVMLIGLYTVRAILDILGATDYGIYNVIGGVVGMFSFLNGTLATSSQRYFSIELAKGNIDRLNKWFCLNISTFSLFIIVFLVVAETIGLWFVNTQLTIPEDRIFAANIIYQFSILSFCFSFLSVPYNALIIAHEKMSAFAYISSVEAILKLVIVFILLHIQYDKLIIYGFLILLTSIGITGTYFIYCRINFIESRYKFYWNKEEFNELLGFSGWHFLGTFSVVIRSQGINILINMFFAPAVNAARAIAYQVYTAVAQLSKNFFMAVTPQIYKSYSHNEFEGLYLLIYRSTQICALLVSILAIPIICNTPFILSLWLNNVPEYTIIFTQLVLINGLIDSIMEPTTTSALATGNLKKYQLVVANIFILNLPISYIVLKIGLEPTITMIVSITLSLISVFVRGYLLRSMIHLPLIKYFTVILKISIATIICLLIVYFGIYNKAYSFLSFTLWSIIIDIIIFILYVIIVFDKSDVKYLINKIIHHNE